MLTNVTVDILERLSNRIRTSEEEKQKAQEELVSLQEDLKGVEKDTAEYAVKRNRILLSDYVSSYIFNICMKRSRGDRDKVLELYQHVITNIIRDIDNFDFDNDTLLITTYLFQPFKTYSKDYAYEYGADISYGHYAVYNRNDKKFISNQRIKTPVEKESSNNNVTYQQDKDIYYADDSDIVKNCIVTRTTEALLKDYKPIEKEILKCFINGFKPRYLSEDFGIPIERIYELIKKFKIKSKESKVLRDYIKCQN